MSFEIEENNIDQILSTVDIACERALVAIGEKAKKYATNLAPVGTPESTGKKGYRGSTLKQSITAVTDNETMTLGSDVEYAPYVELGTGPNFVAPPEWEEFDVPPAKGIGHGYVKPRPFIRPAIADHLSEYENIIKNELSHT